MTFPHGRNQRNTIAKLLPRLPRRTSAARSSRFMCLMWMILILILFIRIVMGNLQLLTVARVESCKTVLDLVSYDPLPKELLNIGAVLIPQCVILHSSTGVRNPDLLAMLEPLCQQVQLFENTKSSSSWTENVKQAHVHLWSLYSNETELLVVEDDASLTDAQMLLWEFMSFRDAKSANYFRPMFNGWEDTHSYRSGTVAYFCRPRPFLQFFKRVGCSSSALPIDICISKFECFQSCSTCPFRHGAFVSTRGKTSFREKSPAT